MIRLTKSYETAKYTLEAVLDDAGALDEECSRRAVELLDEFGFVILAELLTSSETDECSRIIASTLDDPDRHRSGFASQTDGMYGRRDFCAIPTGIALPFVSKLCRSIAPVLSEYCGTTRKVLEISTLTSYIGSSHQYLHRDGAGVLCMFIAADDVSPDQGGTVFSPATHGFSGSSLRHAGRAAELMESYKTIVNGQIFRHNLSALKRLRGKIGISWSELRARVMSRQNDLHQPNVLRFLSGKNPLYDIRQFRLKRVLRRRRDRNESQRLFELVQVTPSRGTVILYRSDIFHAGSDNQSTTRRSIMSVSLARDHSMPDPAEYGFSPHQSLLDTPQTLGDLLALGSQT